MKMNNSSIVIWLCFWTLLIGGATLNHLNERARITKNKSVDDGFIVVTDYSNIIDITQRLIVSNALSLGFKVKVRAEPDGTICYDLQKSSK